MLYTVGMEMIKGLRLVYTFHSRPSDIFMPHQAEVHPAGGFRL